MSNGHLDGVGRTALGMAMVRAVETSRPDRLFEDPYAQAFVDAAPGAFDSDHDRDEDSADFAEVVAAFFLHGTIRTKYFDDYLLDAAMNGCHQVVLVAAGLDTRAYRLAWPSGVRVFEIDLPEVLSFKASVLGNEPAACDRFEVPTDLRGDWSETLRLAGFNPAVRTVWLIEGLVIYLREEDADRLFSAIDALSGAGSRLAFDVNLTVAGSAAALASTMGEMADVAGLWQFDSADPRRWLVAHCWNVSTSELSDFAETYGRSGEGPATGRFIGAVRT